jgi:hypothetical protein
LGPKNVIGALALLCVFRLVFSARALRRLLPHADPSLYAGAFFFFRLCGVFFFASPVSLLLALDWLAMIKSLPTRFQAAQNYDQRADQAAKAEGGAHITRLVVIYR